MLLLDAEVEVAAVDELGVETDAEATVDEEEICCKLLLRFWATSGGLGFC